MTLLIPDTELNIHSSGIRLPEASSMVVGHSSHRDDVQLVPSYCLGIGRLDSNFLLALYIVVAHSGFSVLFPCSISSGNSSREIVYRLCTMTLSAVATSRKAATLSMHTPQHSSQTQNSCHLCFVSRISSIFCTESPAAATIQLSQLNANARCQDPDSSYHPTYCSMHLPDPSTPRHTLLPPDDTIHTRIIRLYYTAYSLQSYLHTPYLN